MKKKTLSTIMLATMVATIPAVAITNPIDSHAVSKKKSYDLYGKFVYKNGHYYFYSKKVGYLRLVKGSWGYDEYMFDGWWRSGRTYHVKGVGTSTTIGLSKIL